MPRRAEIAMSEAEVAAFLAEERIVTCATLGPRGRPHLMPLWYIVRDGVIEAWTYAASQKVLNLERRPEATLLVEAGEGYDALRGAMLECQVEIVRDREEIVSVGVALAHRYGLARPEDPPEAVRAAVARRGAKRVVLRFRPTRIVSWDHRKGGGR